MSDIQETPTAPAGQSGTRTFTHLLPQEAPTAARGLAHELHRAGFAVRCHHDPIGWYVSGISEDLQLVDGLVLADGSIGTRWEGLRTSLAVVRARLTERIDAARPDNRPRWLGTENGRVIDASLVEVAR